MGLEVPDLDDRTFEELLEDVRKRIPVHTEDWTDHNLHDPGITILETLAYVADSELYRLDRITDEHIEKYLALLGEPPRPPKSATAMLGLDPPPGVVGRPIPPDTTIAAEPVGGPVRLFETETPVMLTDASVGAVISEHPDGRSDLTTANRSAGMSYPAFGEAATEGSSLYIGFDGDPFVGGLLDLGIDFHEAGVPEPATHGDEESTFEPSVSVAWEYCPVDEDWHRDEAWTGLAVIRDETKELYEGGIVRLERPSDWPPPSDEMLDYPRPLRWIRCTIVDDGHEIAPRFNQVYTNPVRASHRSIVTDERLVRPDGGEETSARPDQTFAFANAPVLSATVTVGGETWDEVDSFDASGPDDEHYVLDAAAGTIRFGDELGGQIPEPGQEVVAEEYVHGGGAAGNVSANADWQFIDDELAGVGVDRRSVDGGRDADTVEDALGRIQRDRNTPFRAVTTDDYAYVATHTPGLRFGRAAAVVEEAVQPDDRSGECESGKRVRVVIVPFSTHERPEPSDAFLEAVRRHVEKHRLLTDRVSVEPAGYVGVGVSVEIGLETGYSAEGRTAAVESRLNEFLDPLDGYDGEGWPFGRPVYRSEIYETVDAVAGVDCVFDLSLRPTGDGGLDDEGSVTIANTALVYPTDHTVSVRRDYGSCGGEP